MRYQIPTHFHGDIDTATIFHCLENPRGYLGYYQDNQIDKGLEETSLNGYYGKTEMLLANSEKKKTITNIKIINFLKTLLFLTFIYSPLYTS